MGEIFSDGHLEMELRTMSVLRKAVIRTIGNLLHDSVKKGSWENIKNFLIGIFQKSNHGIKENIDVFKVFLQTRNIFETEKQCGYKPNNQVWVKEEINNVIENPDNKYVLKTLTFQSFSSDAQHFWNRKTVAINSKNEVFVKEEIDKFIIEIPDDNYLPKILHSFIILWLAFYYHYILGYYGNWGGWCLQNRRTMPYGS